MAHRRAGSTSVTLKDVAERVGVTAAAASMALAGHSRISAVTTERVKTAATELGYVPSSAARALRSRRAHAVAVIVPNSSQHVFGHSYFTHVLTGVSAVADEREDQVLVSTSGTEAGGLTAYERVLRSRSADGAIVTSAAVSDPNIERLASNGLPVVLIGNYPELADTASVGVDDVAASQQITEHLIDVHGVSRLLHVTGPLDHRTALDRRDGFLGAVRSRGLAAGARVVEGDFSEGSGFDVLEGIDLRGIDGVVFANDDMAFGGLGALRGQGLRVPQDVAVVGFDDFGLSRLTQPGITTMHVPAEAMARRAAERLFAMVDSGQRTCTRDELEATLVTRDSCGCPRQEVTLLRT